ncbi:MAG: hypothetical protein ACLTT1_09730 [[Clostridium] scindens]
MMESFFAKHFYEKWRAEIFGEMDNNILEALPVFGVNKYIVMNANGMEKVRLVK